MVNSMEGRILKIVLIGLVLCLVTSTALAKKATEEDMGVPDVFGDDPFGDDGFGDEGEEPRNNQEHLQMVFGNIREKMLENGKEIPPTLLDMMMDLGMMR